MLFLETGFSAAPVGLGVFFNPGFQGMNPLAKICRPVGADFHMSRPIDVPAFPSACPAVAMRRRKRRAKEEGFEISLIAALKGRQTIARG